MRNFSQSSAVRFSEKHVKTLGKRKEEAFFFSPDENRPINFRKLEQGISIWTKNETDILIFWRNMYLF